MIALLVLFNAAIAATVVAVREHREHRRELAARADLPAAMLTRRWSRR